MDMINIDSNSFFLFNTGAKYFIIPFYIIKRIIKIMSIIQIYLN